MWQWETQVQFVQEGKDDHHLIHQNNLLQSHHPLVPLSVLLWQTEKASGLASHL